MKKILDEVNSLLKEITAGFPVLLGDKLTGIYLYGSLTLGAFDPDRSDIDCIVVTKEELSEEEFAAVGEWLARSSGRNPWTAKLQMSFLLADKILVMDSKACLYQFGRLVRCGSDGNPIFWMNILKSGITLYGPPAGEFVPEITPAVLHEALVRETGYLREEVENENSEWRDVPKYRAYAVLTLCRILYTHATSVIGSKAEAAEWARGALPLELQEMVDRALAGDSGDIPLERIREFIELVSERLDRFGISDLGFRI
jgi:predicted nucleotidyltransferase